jgi:asparagine synthase (glutamine-hydrolysing)
MHWELPNVLDPDLARRGWEELNAFQQLNQVVPRFGAAEKNNDRLECRAARTTSSTSKRANARLAVSALEMTYYLRNQLLRDTDWAGMAHSLEIRVPFVDVALLKQIAPWLAAHPDIEKKDVAAAIVRALPDSVLSKPKTGFSVPVREWLQGERQASAPHGLRGWAAYVYRRFASGVT